MSKLSPKLRKKEKTQSCIFISHIYQNNIGNPRILDIKFIQRNRH